MISCIWVNGWEGFNTNAADNDAFHHMHGTCRHYHEGSRGTPAALYINKANFSPFMMGNHCFGAVLAGEYSILEPVKWQLTAVLSAYWKVCQVFIMTSPITLFHSFCCKEKEKGFKWFSCWIFWICNLYVLFKMCNISVCKTICTRGHVVNYFKGFIGRW